MLLDVKNLRVRYGSMLALRDISISVEEGKLVSLVGANGAGKSTILKSVSGLVPIDKGEITFNGQRIDGKAAHSITRMGVGHVPEGRGVLPTITVAENFAIGAYGRADKNALKSDEDRLLELFPGLKDRWNEPASVLSGGEQQMLSIARALLKQPKLLIIDEMSLGLAPRLVQEILEIVVSLVREGMTVLCVEQNTNLILKHSDYAYVIQTGRVAKEGTGAALLADDTLAAAYLGAAPAAQAEVTS